MQYFPFTLIQGCFSFSFSFFSLYPKFNAYEMGTITLFTWTDNILKNIPSFRLNVRNILYNVVNPT